MTRSLAAVSTGLAPPNIDDWTIGSFCGSIGNVRGIRFSLGRSVGAVSTLLLWLVSRFSLVEFKSLLVLCCCGGG